MNKSNIQIVMASFNTNCYEQTPHKKLCPQQLENFYVYADSSMILLKWN
jgi:hypothetical protein